MTTSKHSSSTSFEFFGLWNLWSLWMQNTLFVHPDPPALEGFISAVPPNPTPLNTAPTALFNVYATPDGGSFILQSQYNGLYLKFITSPDQKILGSENILAPQGKSASEAAQFQADKGTVFKDSGDYVTDLWFDDPATGRMILLYGWPSLYYPLVLALPTDPAVKNGQLKITFYPAAQIYAGGAAGKMPLRYVNMSGQILEGGDYSGYDFTGADLSNAYFDKSTLTGTILRSATLAGTKFDGAKLNGADLTESDLSTVTYDSDTSVTGSSEALTNMTGAKVPYGLLGHRWQWINLAAATIVQLPEELSSKAEPLNAEGAILSGLESDLKGRVLDYADFTGCDLRGVYLESAHMEGANFTGAQLNGANLQFASLTIADLSGAQLGSIALRFKVTQGSDVTAFEKALNGGDVADVETIFQDNGVGLTGSVSIKNSTSAPGRVWTVEETKTDGGTTDYLVRLEALPGGASYIGVFLPSAPALLGAAYLNGATLTSANLYGVNGANAQLYSTANSTTSFDSAILENARFPNANMSGVNLQKTRLYGIELAGAVMTNAQLGGADFSPSETGTQADLTGANLQNSDFSGAKLDGVIFTNAAVALPEATQPDDSDGVWLFNSGGADLAALQAEVKAAASGQFSLDASLQSDLRDGPVENPIRDAFQENGITLEEQATVSIEAYGPTWSILDGSPLYRINRAIDSETTGAPALKVQEVGGSTEFFIADSCEADLVNGPVDAAIIAAFKAEGVTLPSTAEVKAEEKAMAWQISDGAVTYTLWLAIDDLWAWTLYARPSLPALRKWFAGAGLDLRWQATVSGQDGVWALNNDANDPWNRQLGYVVFNLVQDPDGGPLDVYGHQMRIERYVGDNELVYDILVAGPTKLTAEDLTLTTICPNGKSVAENKAQSIPFAEWMLARKPPAPPSCVIPPGGNYYCPQPSGADSLREPADPPMAAAGE